jgi:hypothetical protein
MAVTRLVVAVVLDAVNGVEAFGFGFLSHVRKEVLE